MIPYLAKEAQGCELELAVAGWHKHFKEPHRVVVVGDWDEHVEKLLVCPEGKSEGSITFIDCPQIEPVRGEYLPHLDQMNKFRAVAAAFPEQEYFVYTNDDIYAVKDFTLQDVRLPKINSMLIPYIDEKETRWWGDMGRSRKLCVNNGWPIMDWACHLPVYYGFKLLFYLLTLYCAGKSYEWQNIYFNRLRAAINAVSEVAPPNDDSDIEYREPEIVPERGGKWKYAINTANPGIKTTEEAGAVWITNANCGWSEKLEELLKKHYGL